MIQCTLDILLMHYAAGALEPAEALMAAAHLALNPAARRKIAQYEAVGGRMMAQMPEAAVSDNCLKAVLDMIDHPVAKAARRPAACTPDKHSLTVPECIHALLNDYCDDFSFAWQDLGGGVESIDLKIRAAHPCDRKLSLMRVTPHGCTPAHKHTGMEITVVLNGSYHDERGRYRTGDIVIIHDPAQSHSPAAEDEGCLCLVLTDNACEEASPGAKKGLFGRFFRHLGLG